MPNENDSSTCCESADRLEQGYTQCLSCSCPEADEPAPKEEGDRVASFASRLALDVFSSSALFAENGHRNLTWTDSLTSRLSLSQNDIRQARDSSPTHVDLREARSRSVAGEEGLRKWLTAVHAIGERTRRVNGGLVHSQDTPVNTNRFLNQGGQQLSALEKPASTGRFQSERTSKANDSSARFSWSGKLTSEDLQRQTAIRYASHTSLESLPDNAIFTPSPATVELHAWSMRQASPPPAKRTNGHRKAGRGFVAFLSRVFRGRERGRAKQFPPNLYQVVERPRAFERHNSRSSRSSKRGSDRRTQEWDERAESPSPSPNPLRRSVRFRRSLRNRMRRMRSFSVPRTKADRPRPPRQVDNEYGPDEGELESKNDRAPDKAHQKAYRDEEEFVENGLRVERHANSIHANLSDKMGKVDVTAAGPAPSSLPRIDVYVPNATPRQAWPAHENFSSGADLEQARTVQSVETTPTKDSAKRTTPNHGHTGPHAESSNGARGASVSNRRVQVVYPQPLRRPPKGSMSSVLTSPSRTKMEREIPATGKEVNSSAANKLSREALKKTNSSECVLANWNGGVQVVVPRRPSNNRQLRSTRSKSLIESGSKENSHVQRLEVPHRIAWPTPNGIPHSQTWCSLSRPENGDSPDVNHSEGEAVAPSGIPGVRRALSHGRSAGKSVTLGARLGTDEVSLARARSLTSIFKRRASAMARVGPLEPAELAPSSAQLRPILSISTGCLLEPEKMNGSALRHNGLTVTVADNGEMDSVAPPAPHSKLQPPNKPKEELTDEDLRQHVLRTLLETERKYVTCLQTLCKDYYNTLRESQYPPIIDHMLLEEIFFEVPVIHVCHSDFYRQMCQRTNNWTEKKTIGDLFVDAFSKGTLNDAYSRYINHFHQARDAVRAATHQREKFQRFLEQQCRENEDKLSLSDLMIMPVQRVPRYVLIIKDLLKSTPPPHPDHGLLLQALEQLVALAEKMNRGEEQANQLEVLREIELCFDGTFPGLVSVNRYLVRRDRISEEIGSQHKDRLLMLFSDMIVCAGVRQRTGNKKLSNNPANNTLMQLTGDVAVRYRLLWRASIQGVTVIQTPADKFAEQQAADSLKKLQDDLHTLSQMNLLCDTLSVAHQNLDQTMSAVLKQITDQITEKKNNRDAATVVLEMETKRGTTASHIIAFSSAAEKTTWMTDFEEAKKKFVESTDGSATWYLGQDTASCLLPRVPAFHHSIPMMKTRSGMQIMCASASTAPMSLTAAAVAAKAHGQLWVCTSDGHVGQVCMVDMEKLPPQLPACIAVCQDGGLTCIIAVPEYNSSNYANYDKGQDVDTDMNSDSNSEFDITDLESDGTLSQTTEHDDEDFSGHALASDTEFDAAIPVYGEERQRGLYSVVRGHRRLPSQVIEDPAESERWDDDEAKPLSSPAKEYQTNIPAMESITVVLQRSLAQKEVPEEVKERNWHQKVSAAHSYPLVKRQISEELSPSQRLQKKQKLQKASKSGRSASSSTSDDEENGMDCRTPMQEQASRVSLSKLPDTPHASTMAMSDSCPQSPVSNFDSIGRAAYRQAQLAMDSRRILQKSYSLPNTPTQKSNICGGLPVVVSRRGSSLPFAQKAKVRSRLGQQAGRKHAVGHIHPSQPGKLLSLSKSPTSSASLAAAESPTGNFRLHPGAGLSDTVQQLVIGTSRTPHSQISSPAKVGSTASSECSSEGLVHGSDVRLDAQREHPVEQSNLLQLHGSSAKFQQNSPRNSSTSRSGSDVSSRSRQISSAVSTSTPSPFHESRQRQQLARLSLSSETHVISPPNSNANEASRTHIDHEPTIWLGTDSKQLVIYRAGDSIRMRQRRTVIKLNSSVITMCRVDSVVFVSLENGQLLLFTRNADGDWQVGSPEVVPVGKVDDVVTCMTPVHHDLWCGIHGRIYVVSVATLDVKKSFNAVENQFVKVAHMVCNGRGVYVAMESGPLIRVFHALTHCHLLDIDISSSVQQMLSGSVAIIRQHKMRCLRVTVIQSYQSHIWVGTSAGVVLTIPAVHIPKLMNGQSLTTPHVQASYHGHTGPVRFITAVECKPKAADEADKSSTIDSGTSRKISTENTENRDSARPHTGSTSSQRDSTGSLGNLAALASLASGLLVPMSVNSSLFLNSQQPSATPSIAEEAEVERSTPVSDLDILVVAGGDGYEDFKATPMGDNDAYDEGGSHMLVWKIN